jgi:hypothetical protein
LAGIAATGAASDHVPPVNDGIAAPPLVIPSLTLSFEVNDGIAPRASAIPSLAWWRSMDGQACGTVRHHTVGYARWSAVFAGRFAYLLHRLNQERFKRKVTRQTRTALPSMQCDRCLVQPDERHAHRPLTGQRSPTEGRSRACHGRE